MRVLHEFLDDPQPCPYLAGRESSMLYQLVSALDAAEYESAMQAGVRKFGQLLFSPHCVGCNACQPIRVRVPQFRPDRSMLRCLNSNADLTVLVSAAKSTADRVDLYNRYHQYQSKQKKWNHSWLDADSYESQFINSPILIEELSLYKNDRLIGLMLFEELPNGVSLVYHFYEPGESRRGLGNYLILKTIEIAKCRAKKFCYLGYYVENSASMQYKAKFQPNELLIEEKWIALQKT